DRLVFARRFIALLFVVIVLNMVWQYFRVWLPKMLEQFHHYSPGEVRYFVIAYYIATDLGCLGSGLLVKWLVRRGTHVHTARLTAFGICALLTSLSTVAAGLPKGPLLLSLFLVIGFGALGLFPNYYSFTQELSERHQGKISGTLGFTTWVITSEMQELIGKEVDRTQSYEQAIFWIGLTPLVGLAAMLLLWGRQEPSK
ncbi:MAG: MFS transporter, partial [Pirellulaceae bacterium]